jgi:hypothetical protein
MLCLLVIETRKRKKKKKRPGSFFSEQTHPAGCVVLGFSEMFGAIKSCFKGSVLEFYVHLMCWQLLFWLEANRITQV